MNVLIPRREESHPVLQLFLLCAYWAAGAILFTLIGFVVVFMMYGTSILQHLSELMSGDPLYTNGLKVIQIFSSIGMFILPPIALAYTEGRKPGQFYGFEQPKALALILVLLIMVFSMPFMEWTALVNQKMILPDFLKGVERWMRQKEDEAMKITLLLITVRSNWDFIINLLMIALLPAIGEELMFRGGIQRAFTRMFGNPHVAIWAAAFIFSAIHFQFYGFLPRLLLGAGFGYLYYWSGSIWYAMLAHFLNNAYAVCAALYMQKHNMPLDQAEDPIGFHWYGYIISAILTIALFTFFKEKVQRERKLG